MYAHGLSTRDIADAFTDATGSYILSKSAVSQVTEKLWRDYQAFQQQRWDAVEILHLFADGLAEPLSGDGDHRDAVLCLGAICSDGRKRLLAVPRGNTESREAWLEVLRDLIRRGMGAPVLMTSDGAPDLTAALEEVFLEALRHPCLSHKTRNVTAQVSAQDLPQGKADGQSAYYAANPEVAKLVADAVVKKWQPTYPAAMASFLAEVEACLASLRCPPDHHKYIRTTNLAERAIEEERRRTKTIPPFFKDKGGERGGLKLCYAALLRASERWQRVTINDFDRTRRGKTDGLVKGGTKTGGATAA